MDSLPHAWICPLKVPVSQSFRFRGPISEKVIGIGMETTEIVGGFLPCEKIPIPKSAKCLTILSPCVIIIKEIVMAI